ncbi:MAG TPA: cysteine desulfurase family protein [Verrucomicrobiae bacterium]|nr:cysteine desulfurase family protein [Verrucomicrobiae bacterium]
MIYFDHNATTPLLPQARQAWLEAMENFIGNPSSPHRIGGRADAAITSAREHLAGFLGCDGFDIVWTSGATESNNTVIHHFARVLDAGANVWISSIEHPCVLSATRHYFPKRHRLIPVTHGGVVDLNWMAEEMTHERPGLVAIMAANNETGVLQPWREALAICRQYEVPFFCDAAQWTGKLPAAGLGDCDFVSGAAHKFGGPKGVGFLKCPGKGRVEPLLRGGPQEEGRRAGTENVAGVLSMMAALQAREAALAGAEEAEIKDHRRSASKSKWPAAVTLRLGWRDGFVERMLKALPGAELIGLAQPRLWNTVSALMPQAGGHQRWVVKLDKSGFAVSTGSACSSGKEEPSHVLAAMGYSPSAAGRVLRFSSGWEATEDDWNALLEGLQTVRHGMTRAEKQATS